MSIEFLWFCDECKKSNEMSDWECIYCNASKKSADSCVKLYQTNICSDKKKDDCKIVEPNIETDDCKIVEPNIETDDISVEQNLIAKTMFNICEFIVNRKFDGISDDDITENSKNIFNSHFEFHFSNCLKIDKMLHLIDSGVFGSGGTRWRAAYEYPKNGDDITLHQKYGIAKDCGFFTFTIYGCDDGERDYCDYCDE